MRRVGLVVLVFLFAALLAPPASAKCPGKVLGHDERGDAPAQFDLVGLMALRCGPDLGIIFNVQQVNAASAVYSVVHARWAFKVDERAFVVESDTVPGSSFVLYEWSSGELQQLDTVKGSYDTYNDMIGVLVPMKLVGAKVGSRVSGAHELDAADGAFRLSVGTSGHALDSLTTTREFVVPRWRFRS